MRDWDLSMKALSKLTMQAHLVKSMEPTYIFGDFQGIRLRGRVEASQCVHGIV